MKEYKWTKSSDMHGYEGMNTDKCHKQHEGIDTDMISVRDELSIVRVSSLSRRVSPYSPSHTFLRVTPFSVSLRITPFLSESLLSLRITP